MTTEELLAVLDALETARGEGSMERPSHYVLVWRLAYRMDGGSRPTVEDHVLAVESEDRAAYLTRYVNERLPTGDDPLHSWRAQYGPLVSSGDAQNVYEVVAQVNARG